MAEGDVGGSPPRDLLDRYKNKYRKIDLDKAKGILQEHFGIAEFKEKQMECLNAIKNFEHVLNIMPTGGGKSLIYQVTPLLIEGISIVISPLISLMHDQTKSLRTKNIVAETINSSHNKKENEKILNLLKDFNNCDIKVLYITPETATSDNFMLILKELYMHEKISLISIDEVHCISTWGCDFRKSYRNLSKVLKACPYVRVYTCTATATKCVERDIIVNLNLDGRCAEEVASRREQTNYQVNGLASDKQLHILRDAPRKSKPNEGGTLNSLRIVRTSFNRPNLKYVIVYSDLINTEKKKSIFHIIQEKRNVDKIGIIYCFKRNTCDEISKYLRQQGFQALSYHAGLSNSARKRIQEKWVNGNAKILVATIAFGMGIDRKDVSFIIHFNLPTSIENYYQESGRSGRNGSVSFCYLYYCREDVQKLSYIIRSKYANVDMGDLTLQKKYEQEIYNLQCMHNLCVQEKCVRSQILAHFGEHSVPKGGIGSGSGGGSGSGSGHGDDDDYCCSYCSDVKGSKNKIERVMEMYQGAPCNIQSNDNITSINHVNSFTSVVHKRKHELSDYSESDKEPELGQYKLSNKKIKGFVPFQSASSIIPKEIRDKGIIEVMKELEKREELMGHKLDKREALMGSKLDRTEGLMGSQLDRREGLMGNTLEERAPKIGKMLHSISHFTNVKKNPVFSSFKVPRRL
ncbi:hypothetical protein AK88_01699 [Plasmodium fragile]|uniref:DNA 3'-5' helicase n=1 Tax=Plasmodium fragile TaxID=5857 RepID=A0A0D9QNK9_PLAFR|nr:uncharacterized protein AK88_01699 [Plasmodium fragile]KJP88619.1 hypothetical protein AK88_01699 [Plasmodium fragile]